MFSCHSGKELSSKWDVELPQKTELDINHTYMNVGTQNDSEKYPISLWNQLNKIPVRSEFYNANYTNDSTLSVKLQLSNDSSILNAYLISSDSTIDTLSYKGRVEKNYFFVDQSTKKLFTPIIWYVNHSQMIISSEPNDKLTLRHLKHNQGVFLLFIGASGGGTSISKFKIKN